MPTQKGGAIAQLVEQRTENPCVAGSIPAGTTRVNKADHESDWLLFFNELSLLMQNEKRKAERRSLSLVYVLLRQTG